MEDRVSDLSAGDAAYRKLPSTVQPDTRSRQSPPRAHAAAAHAILATRCPRPDRRRHAALARELTGSLVQVPPRHTFEDGRGLSSSRARQQPACTAGRSWLYD